ncbi:MAG: lipoyl synthase, partial [Candidatus Omnitrophica bacterium]|nr:lipoyl synthase [Candidatus Omnitrophota bacterium]
SHVVITSVTRDDLPNGGAEVFAGTIFSVRKRVNKVVIEVLIPDFKLNKWAIKAVADAKPEIIGHNVETVPRLYDKVRRDSNYIRSLKVLELARKFGRHVYTKSGIMLGLGEKEKEVLGVFSDLREVNCDFLSIGQYLAPSLEHFPVEEYIHPEKFLYYKQKALQLGFLYVVSGPYVRSSYLASEYMDKKRWT